MNLDYLARRLYPRMPTGRRNYQIRVLLVAISVGLLMGGTVVAIICWHAGVAK